MSIALIIIDIQNFYFGENGLDGSVEASLNAKRLLHYFRDNCLPVFHVQHIKDDASNLTAEQKTIVQIHQNVEPIEGEAVIVKKTPGSFKGTQLLEKLRKKDIDELVICGMMSNMCVDTTTREAFDLDFKCNVIYDACATRKYNFNGKEIPSEYVHATAMASLAFAFAKVISVNEFLS
ncbi:MAG: cysteine hydrolase family protein [Ruminiclostridium sp.]